MAGLKPCVTAATVTPHPWDHRIPARDMAKFRWGPPSEAIEVTYG
jgi:hypothetical protein